MDKTADHKPTSRSCWPARMLARIKQGPVLRGRHCMLISWMCAAEIDQQLGGSHKFRKLGTASKGAWAGG